MGPEGLKPSTFWTGIRCAASCAIAPSCWNRAPCRLWAPVLCCWNRALVNIVQGKRPKACNEQQAGRLLRQQQSIEAHLLAAYGARGARTLNLLDWDQMRCQLRHSPKLLEQGPLSTVGPSFVLLERSPRKICAGQAPKSLQRATSSPAFKAATKH